MSITSLDLAARRGVLDEAIALDASLCDRAAEGRHIALEKEVRFACAIASLHAQRKGGIWHASCYEVS
ncbi:hypothetical protein [Microseira sp. BLCC-F43]|uniref:hypothetical protein n=1 Tax=Microseira sp. BLCC-F43 TaxID=3153602 RepID=UPI0035B9190B